MSYALIENGEIGQYPVNLAQDFPHVSMAPGALPPGVVQIIPTNPPAHDHTQYPVEGTPEFVGGLWKQTWTLANYSQTEIDAAVEAEFERLRIQRNALLTACDWTQIPDSPLTAQAKADWATYRQALRDFPETTTDPFNPEWPVPPSL